MGIYVFNWDKLRKYLTEDEAKEDSHNDFGKDILPTMLAEGNKMQVYRFGDYWKDVGTIESLWDANLDLLNPKIDLNLSDPKWKIYSGTQGLPPQYISDTAKVENSLVTVGCNVYGKLDLRVGSFCDSRVFCAARLTMTEQAFLLPLALYKGVELFVAFLHVNAGGKACDDYKRGKREG
jgi:glucose-1-phosphate adenylyltransferase